MLSEMTGGDAVFHQLPGVRREPCRKGRVRRRRQDFLPFDRPRDHARAVRNRRGKPLCCSWYYAAARRMSVAPWRPMALLAAISSACMPELLRLALAYLRDGPGAGSKGFKFLRLRRIAQEVTAVGARLADDFANPGRNLFFEIGAVLGFGIRHANAMPMPAATPMKALRGRPCSDSRRRPAGACAGYIHFFVGQLRRIDEATTRGPFQGVNHEPVFGRQLSRSR